MNSNILKIGSFICIIFMLSACTNRLGNTGQMQIYYIPSPEPEWIREGDPIEFEGELWYPHDGVENLLDAEVYLLGEYQGIQFFVEKIDVRPYNRLYTKFGRNSFRYYERNTIDD